MNLSHLGGVVGGLLPVEGPVGLLDVFIQLGPECRSGPAAPHSEGGAHQKATSKSVQGRVHNDESARRNLALPRAPSQAVGVSKFVASRPRDWGPEGALQTLSRAGLDNQPSWKASVTCFRDGG